jgi:hypothetical protein
MRFALALVLFGLTLLGQTSPTSVADIRIIIDPSVDQSKVDIRRWWSIVAPIAFAVSNGNGATTLRVRFTPGFNGGSPCPNREGEVVVNFGAYPQVATDVGSSVYRTLTHDLKHGLFQKCPPRGTKKIDWYMQEGEAETFMHIIYEELAKANSSIKPSTSLLALDTLLSQSTNFCGVVNNPLEFDFACRPYQQVGGLVEALVHANGGDFKCLDKIGHIHDWSGQLAEIDAHCKGVNGLSASLWLQKATAAIQPQDGLAFGAYATGTPTSLGANSTSAVNPTAIVVQLFERNTVAPGVATYQQKIPEEVLVKISGVANQPQLSFKTKPQGSLIIMVGTALLEDLLNSLPDGAYKLQACALTAEDGCDEKLTSVTFFARYRAFKEGMMAVILNGPRFEDLSETTKVSPTAASGVVAQAPGLLVLSNPPQGEVMLTDGLFQRLRSALGVPTVWLWTHRSEPTLTALNIREDEAGQRFAELYGRGLATGAPMSFPSGQLLCGGAEGMTHVMLKVGGRTYEASILYLSQRQINIRLPADFPADLSTAMVVVEVNGATSAPFALSTKEP